MSNTKAERRWNSLKEDETAVWEKEDGVWKVFVRKLTEDQTDARRQSLTTKILQVIRLIAH